MLPLDGVRVLDLTRFLSGPYCTMVMADMGAEVIKVERFPEGDDSRRLGPKIEGESYPFAMPNRGKRSIALDLAQDRGREVFLELAWTADVVIENFRPGVMRRLGLDYPAVRGVRPEIIYCSISGFGQTGPYRDRPGFDIMAQGVSGLMRMTGFPDGRPAKVGIAICDLAAGVTALYAILGAYLVRGRTGEGQHIDVSLVDSVLAWTLWEAGAYFGSGEVPTGTGTRHRRSTPYQAYRTADGFVTIGANTQRLWQRLAADVLERPEWLDDPRFATLADRMTHIDELEAEIEAITATRGTRAWIERLDSAGVPGGPVLGYHEALADPHVLAREMVAELDHPVFGRMRTVGIPAKLSGTPLRPGRPAPLLGEHTLEVLAEAGFHADRLVADGVAHQYQAAASVPDPPGGPR
ncbi:MAG: CoA transferase [Streptosporangiales bacterium]|nr:CoA transferase [Streptosporangiales bacterium]